MLDVGLLKEACEVLTPKDFFPVLSSYDGSDFEAQEAYVNDRSAWSFAGAAARTGKTYGAADQFQARIAEDMILLPFEDEKLYWCVAPTHQLNAAQAKQLKRLIPDYMIDWRKMYARSKNNKNWGARFGEGQGGTIYLHGNITIELRSAHNPESLVAEKVRGIWITEVAKIKIASWSNIVERLGNYDDSWLIGDTTPMGHNWFYREVWEPAQSGKLIGVGTHAWTAYDSPYVSKLKIEAAKNNLSNEFFQRGFMASWGAFYGKIYNQWDKKKHCVKKCPFKPKRVILSADLNANTERPAAFGVYFVGGNYRDANHVSWPRMHLEREWYQPIGLDYERYADAILLHVRKLAMEGYTEERGNFKLIIDPASHKQFKSMLRSRGMNPWNGDNEVKKGIMTLGGAMVPKHDGNPIFTINERCKAFPKEVNGYSWKVNSQGIALEEPDKTQDDHMLDNARYAGMDVWNGFGTGGRIKTRAA